MKKLLLSLIFIFTVTHFFAQKLIVKNLQGEDVDFNQVLNKSEEGQPTLIVTWADAYCGVCETIINELQKQYTPLKEKYNLRVITLNTDSNIEDMFKKHYKSEFEDKMGPYSSITDFVRNYKGIQKWSFEKYVDEYGNFFKTAGLKGAPVFYIFYNKKTKYYKYGFNVPKEAKSSDGSSKLRSTTSELTIDNLIKILESMHASESYFNSNWLYTLKDENPTYKRTILKDGSLYEITDSWIAGEKYMRGTYKDQIGTIHQGQTIWYYKNGNKKYLKNYEANKLNGEYVSYHENGNIFWKGMYKNGMYEGKWEGFYENGTTMSEKLWSEGKLMSINYFTDPNGKTLLTNGTGTYKEINIDGSISYEVSYENNKLHGQYKELHKNGKIKTKGTYWNNKKDSVWYYYNENGEEEKSDLWERGQRVSQ